MTGRIKKLHEKGFGFIAGPNGSDIFFHSTGVPDKMFDRLQVGQLVSYETENSDKGPRATNVRPA